MQGRLSRWALSTQRCRATVSAPRGLLTGRGRSGRRGCGGGRPRWAPHWGSRKGESVGVSAGNGQPNQRLKLTAPGLGRNCVCAPTSCGVSLHLDGADADGRRSLAATR